MSNGQHIDYQHNREVFNRVAYAMGELLHLFEAIHSHPEWPERKREQPQVAERLASVEAQILEQARMYEAKLPSWAEGIDAYQAILDSMGEPDPDEPTH
jgi:hypothetical protein